MADAVYTSSVPRAYMELTEKDKKNVDEELLPLSNKEVKKKIAETEEKADHLDPHSRGASLTTMIKAVPAVVVMGTLLEKDLMGFAALTATFTVGAIAGEAATGSTSAGMGISAALMAGVSYLSFKSYFNTIKASEKLFEKADYMRETLKKRASHNDSVQTAVRETNQLKR